MNARLAIIDPWAQTRWLSAAVTLTLLSIVGLVVAIPDIDRHPIVFALSMNWLVGGVVGVVTRYDLLRTNPWQIRFAHWEHEGRVYRYVGVKAFRWLLLQTPVGWLNPTLRTTARKSDLENLLRQMNFAEGVHLIGGGITACLAVGFAAGGHVRVGLALAVIAVVSHIYPIIMQRWNRGRIARIVRRCEPGSARMGKA